MHNKGVNSELPAIRRNYAPHHRVAGKSPRDSSCRNSAMNSPQNESLVCLCEKMNGGLASLPKFAGTCHQQGVSPKETLQVVKARKYKGKLSFIYGVFREVCHD